MRQIVIFWMECASFVQRDNELNAEILMELLKLEGAGVYYL